MIVVDASAMLAVLLTTPAGVPIGERLFADEVQACAPTLLDLEVAQVLRRLCREGHCSDLRADQAIQDLGDFALQRFSHEALLRRVWQLRHNVTAYDAAYLALAEALEAPLITCDARLHRAPGHRARIELFHS
ncbi:MAG: type II toxin-antitoxin system VapC family toxin [Acidobacteriota bacterium]